MLAGAKSTSLIHSLPVSVFLWGASSGSLGAATRAPIWKHPRGYLAATLAALHGKVNFRTGFACLLVYSRQGHPWTRCWYTSESRQHLVMDFASPFGQTQRKKRFDKRVTVKLTIE